MREILFRGKRVDNGDWVEGGISFGLCQTPYICPTMQNIEVIPETVGQYTGLTDKNGKKIFEGDICTDGEIIYEVVFNRYQFSIKVIKTLFYLIQKGDIFPLSQFDNCKRNGYRQLEVIENIHDNPELLEEK